MRRLEGLADREGELAAPTPEVEPCEFVALPRAWLFLGVDMVTGIEKPEVPFRRKLFDVKMYAGGVPVQPFKM